MHISRIMNIFIPLIMILFLAIHLGEAVEDMNSQRYWMDKAREYYLEKAYDPALECVDNFLKNARNDTEALVLKGSIMVRLGKSSEALPILERALAQETKNAKAWSAEGEAYHNLADDRKAIECYDRSLDIDYSYAEAWYGKGLALDATGKKSEAKSCYDKAIGFDPSIAYSLPPQIDTSPTNNTVIITPSGTDQALITWDFETNDLRGWNKTGDALENQPVSDDTVAVRGKGHEGRYWIDTSGECLNSKRVGDASYVQGCKLEGTLTSLPFIIKGKSISFLLGGADSSSVNLIINGSAMLTTYGRNSDTMDRVEWNVSSYKGKPAVIEVIDNNSRDNGYISFDDVRFDQKPIMYDNSVEVPLGVEINPV